MREFNSRQDIIFHYIVDLEYASDEFTSDKEAEAKQISRLDYTLGKVNQTLTLLNLTDEQLQILDTYWNK
jgi:hypothetical protein